MSRPKFGLSHLRLISSSNRDFRYLQNLPFLLLTCSYTASIKMSENVAAATSSSSMTTIQGPSPPRVIIPKSQPISILPNEPARLYRNIHPALILSLFYFSFSQLVADPVTTLTRAIAPIASLQLLYCVICLPPYSSGSSSSSSSSATNTSSSASSSSSASASGVVNKTPKRKRVQFAKAPPTIWSKIIVSFPVSFHGRETQCPARDISAIIGVNVFSHLRKTLERLSLMRTYLPE